MNRLSIAMTLPALALLASPAAAQNPAPENFITHGPILAAPSNDSE